MVFLSSFSRSKLVNALKKFKSISFFFSKNGLISVLCLALVLSHTSNFQFLWSQKRSPLDVINNVLQPKALAQNTNRSAKHKYVDGGWIIPFEIYDQTFYRSVSGGSYASLPVRVDLNGDGIPDSIFSRYYPPRSLGSGVYTHTNLEQYIDISDQNGSFRRVYTCNQKTQTGTSGRIKYYEGDCADMSYTGNNPIHSETSWTPGRGIYNLLQAPNKRAKVYENFGYGDASRLFDQQDVYYDRSGGKMVDVNGDGLTDMVFSAYLGISNYNAGFETGSAYGLLINNGNGFDISNLCLNDVTKLDSYGAVHMPNYRITDCY